MHRVKVAWAWLMAHMWALWAAVFLGIAALWLVRERKAKLAAAPKLGGAAGQVGAGPSIWEEAAAFGAEEAAWHRQQREQIITQRAHDLGLIQVQEQELDKIQQVEDTSKRNEEMARWLEQNL